MLWIGSFQGLIKIDQKPFKFNLYRKDTELNLDFGSNNIASLYKEDENKIWVGTWGAGLSILNRKTNQITQYNTRNKSSSFQLSDDNVLVIYPDSKERVWVGTSNGLYRYNKKDGVLKLCPVIEKTNGLNFLKQNRIYCIKESLNGTLWIGARHGLYNLNPATNQLITYFNLQSDSSEFSINTVYCVVEEKDNLWIGTDRGLVKLNLTTNKFKLYTTASKNVNKRISSNFVFSLLFDSYGTLWAGTTSGLDEYNEFKDEFTIYTEEQGLPNNLIYSILEGKEGNIWLSTNRGLVKFNRAENTFNGFDLADGLQSYEYNIGSSCKSLDNEMFFGGINGFNSFYPEAIIMNQSIPNIVITSFELITKKGVKHIYIDGDKSIDVSYNTNMFNIEFAALDFTFPQKNNYAYQISSSGEQGEWVMIGKRHIASFSNLPAGEYTFRVKGSNNDNIWNTRGASIIIVIESPWWRTKLAFVLYGIFTILSVYLWYLYRTRTLRHTNKILREKEQASLIVARQKEELIIKNKSITDSINYAKRIQESLMPSEKLFKRLLPQSFVYHRPKDIVSGDFYWVNERKGKVFVAAVDCTGHGVPGAFMSILGFELFRRITHEGKEDPAEILNAINKEFIDFFNDQENISLRDGMDITICVFDKKNFQLEFAGAINPIYVIRNNKINEIKGDRFSISLYQDIEKQSFKKYVFNLEKNDVVYMFSDGYADQFGGPEGKKYKYRRFRHLLLNIHKLPLEEQKAFLDESIENWKGNLEQVDDILIIGIVANFDN